LRFVPEEERWKSGWLGRPGASDILLPLCDRAWFGGNWGCCMLWTELERFMAEEGIGIAELLLFTGPNVCAMLETVCVRDDRMVRNTTYLAGTADREHTRIGHVLVCCRNALQLCIGVASGGLEMGILRGLWC
jgi:hypothetical protein